MSITTVLLCKENALDNYAEISSQYLDKLEAAGISKGDVLPLPLIYNTDTKIVAKTAKAYLDKLIIKIPETVTNMIIADSNYFKVITKKAKVSDYYGAVLNGAYPGYEKYSCVYIPNYKSLFKQPENIRLIDAGIKAITSNGNTQLINSAEYGFAHGSDRDILDHLYQHQVLTVDIETTGLDLHDNLISIAFAWTKHDGAAIDISITGIYWLKDFFEKYRGQLIFHNGLFDVKMLVHSLWMEHDKDYEGMMRGLHNFKTFDDTMILAYLAKNATTPISLGLKEIALEYVGNYAIELTDITKHTKKEILQYNLIDALATFYAYETYIEQLSSEAYLEIFKPSLYTLTKMMLIGLPMSSERVMDVHNILEAKNKVLHEQIQENKHVKKFTKTLQRVACTTANSKLKKLVKTIKEFYDVQFNPSSHQQLALLLFGHLKLPILDKTKSGAPATGGQTLKDLANHTTDQDILDLLEFIQELSEVDKIDGTFIKAFMKETDVLHGNLKLGGTQSGRLSSNSPNLTNLPAHGSM